MATKKPSLRQAVRETDSILATKRTKEQGEVIRSELTSLAGPDRIVYPGQVVDAARDPKSILHPLFTWDDTEAAEKYRLVQARTLIGSFRITVPERNIRVQAFTSLRADKPHGGGYRFIGDVMRNPGLKEQLIDQALKEVEGVQKKYQNLEELGTIWDAVETVRGEVEVPELPAP